MAAFKSGVSLLFAFLAVAGARAPGACWRRPATVWPAVTRWRLAMCAECSCTRGAGAAAQGDTFANLNAAYEVEDTHTIFRAAVAAANLTDAVLNTSSFTMFIPSDAVSAPAPPSWPPWGPAAAAEVRPLR